MIKLNWTILVNFLTYTGWSHETLDHESQHQTLVQENETQQIILGTIHTENMNKTIWKAFDMKEIIQKGRNNILSKYTSSPFYKYLKTSNGERSYVKLWYRIEYQKEDYDMRVKEN